MDISNFTSAQNETFAILLSEGFDYSASYEASIFYGENLIDAMEYAKSRSSLRINAICETSSVASFAIVETNPKEMAPINVNHIPDPKNGHRSMYACMRSVGWSSGQNNTNIDGTRWCMCFVFTCIFIFPCM